LLGVPGRGHDPGAGRQRGQGEVTAEPRRTTVAVAEHLSFTRAADALRNAQQSLSQQVTVLERGLGVRLLDRDTRGTRLTEIGRSRLTAPYRTFAGGRRRAARSTEGRRLPAQGLPRRLLRLIAT
jgi:DNA-binding transcriptional LysR family regulator